jgi:hypothetical protein
VSETFEPPVLVGACQEILTEVESVVATVVGWAVMVEGMVAERMVEMGEKSLHPCTFYALY